MNPNKRPPPSSAGAFEGSDGLARDATKRARDFPDGKILRPGQEQPGNVLLVRVSDIVHPVTLLELQQIFSVFGKVDKIVMFDKGSGFQALVQMSDVYSAMTAHDAADMQEMYPGCNLIRVGYSNLQNVTVKSNTERSWDFNEGPPLEGMSAPGTASSTGDGPVAPDGTIGYRRGPAGGAPVTQPYPVPAASHAQRHGTQQMYSPYSAAQQHQQQQQPLPQQQMQHQQGGLYGDAPPAHHQPQDQQQPQHYQQQQQEPSQQPQQPQQQQQQQQQALNRQPQQQPQQQPPQQQQPQQQSYAPGLQQNTYGVVPAQAGFPPQQQNQQSYNNEGNPYAQNSLQPGSNTYMNPPYGQQGYAPPFAQATPPPFSATPYSPQPYGQNYPARPPQRGGGEDSSGNNSLAGIGPSGTGVGTFSRPPPQPPGNFYQSSPNVMASQGAAYGSIPFSSDQGPNGFGTLGMNAGRPMTHAGRPAMGAVSPSMGAPGGAGGVHGGGVGYGAGNGTRGMMQGGGRGGRSGGIGGRGGYGGGGGGGGRGGSPLLQTPPAHRQIGSGAVHDNNNYRSQMRFRLSDKTASGVGSGGTHKTRSRLPRLDPLHIQTLSGSAAQKPARRRELAEEVAEEAGRKASAGAKRGAGSSEEDNSGKKQPSSNKKKLSTFNDAQLDASTTDAGESCCGDSKSVTDGAEGTGKKANKREAAEMLGPDATDQLAAATAKVRVSDTADEDGENKRANKREAAEMLGPDEADQLAAATAKVRVSDEVNTGEDGKSQRRDGEPEAVTPAPEGTNSQEESDLTASEGQPPTDEGTDAKGEVEAETTSGNDGDRRDAEANGNGDAANLKPGVMRAGDRVPREGGELADADSGDEERVAPDITEAGDQVPTQGGNIGGKGTGAMNSGVSRITDEKEVGASKDDTGTETRASDKAVGEDFDGEKGTDGEVAEADAVAEGEGKRKSQGDEEEDEDEDEDAAPVGGGAERVDVGAWAAAAPASRSPILLVRHVDAQEVTPGALCQLFGLYGDVMKVKLVASRGMALVQMKYGVQAVNAQRLLDQTPLCGMILEVKASSQWSINDPRATDFSEYQGVHRHAAATSPEDPRYRDMLSPPCPTLVVDNISPGVSADEITDIFAKHGAVSSVDMDTNAEATLDPAPTVPAPASNPELKPSVQALVHMEADGRVGATEAAVHALVMTHNLLLHSRRLQVSFLSGKRHLEK